MAHTQLPEELPGIRGLMAYRPETATALSRVNSTTVLFFTDDDANRRVFVW